MNAYSVGVDLGGTNLRVASYVPGKGLQRSISLPTRLGAGRDAVVDDMCGAIRQLMLENSLHHSLAGIGIGTPGPLELPEGRLHGPPNLPGWDGFNLREAVEDRLESAVMIESDANLAALAEARLGSGRTLGVDSLCMLTLGTGIGNGIILEGRIWQGNNGMAGEAGHLTIWADGEACGCGGAGCMEMYASATAVVRMAKQAAAEGAPGLAALDNITARDLASLAEAGDRTAQAIFHKAGRAIGIGLAGLVNTLNLPLYVVGGGLANAWPLFSPQLFAEVEYRSYVYRLTGPMGRTVRKTHILPAELGPEAGILGACILPLTEGSSQMTTSPSLL